MSGQFPVNEGDLVRALDGVNKDQIGTVLYTPDLDGPWYELEAEDGQVIVAYNVERIPDEIAALFRKLARGETESQLP